MQTQAKINPFGFLKAHREQAFRVAIDAANKRHQASLENSAHIYERMSNRGKSFNTREWSIAHIMEAFSGDERAEQRSVNGISGIVLDDLYFLHFKLIRDLNVLEDRSQPIDEPKTILKARKKKYQTSFLADLILDENQQKRIPFEDLYFVVVAYIKSETGLITSLFFIDQDEEAIIDIKELDLSYAPIPRSQDVKQPPKPTFKLKANNDQLKAQNQ